MMFQKTSLIIGFALVALTAAFAMSQNERQYRVVIQVTADTPAEWEAIVGNIDNLRKSLGAGNAQIEVVAHGKGIGMVLRSNQAMADRMQDLAKEGVVFAGCENTMRKKGLTRDDLLPFVTTVDSGVAHVVRRQSEGWSYVRFGS